MSVPEVHLSPSCSVRGKSVRLQQSKDSVSDVVCRDVFAFLGVPYAEPPTGQLRFKPPQPIKHWSGARDATQFGGACPQNLAMFNKLPIPVIFPSAVSEDCLFVNIWTPSLEKSAKLPVMFWIHGGGFVGGFSDAYDGDVLPNFHDVVVVTINYRLGAFGFLCLDNSIATGNYGMLDQIEALKWVQQHIANFGGDPDNVTIFGESAGGISVSLLMICPMAKGLFKRAIAESGTALIPGFFYTPSVATKLISAQLPKIPGCPALSDDNNDAVVEFLRQQPVDAIVGLGDSFGPVVDGKIFPAGMREMYSSGQQFKGELMVGCNSDEGYCLLGFILAAHGDGVDAKSLDHKTTRAIIFQMMLRTGITEDVANHVSHAIMAEYFPETTSDFFRAFIEFCGDFYFIGNIIEFAGLHSSADKTYFYHFNKRPGFYLGPDDIRADHGVEAYYVFGLVFKPFYSKSSASDMAISRTMMTYWTNFAKTGNPNGAGLLEWPEYDKDRKQHILLDEVMKTGSRLKESRVDFWINKIPSMLKTVL